MSNAAIRLLRGVTKSVSRLYPLYSGCGTIANTPLYRLLSSDPELVEARLRDGSVIQVHLNDYVGRALYFFGDLDPKISWIARRVLRPGDTMVDVGANYGLVTLQAARLVGPGGRVHAFEPQEELAELIRGSCRRNGYTQVTVHPVGLSDADAETSMTIPEHNRGMASVNPDLRGGHTIPIRLKQASGYLRGLGLSKVRLMKLDVEGHEAAVFAGAEDRLRDVKPEVIVFETAEDAPAFRANPSVALLSKLDYAYFGIPRVRLAMRLEKIDAAGGGPVEFHDIVAVHRGDRFAETAALPTGG